MQMDLIDQNVNYVATINGKWQVNSEQLDLQLWSKLATE